MNLLAGTELTQFRKGLASVDESSFGETSQSSDMIAMEMGDENLICPRWIKPCVAEDTCCVPRSGGCR